MNGTSDYSFPTKVLLKWHLLAEALLQYPSHLRTHECGQVEPIGRGVDRSVLTSNWRFSRAKQQWDARMACIFSTFCVRVIHLKTRTVVSPPLKRRAETLESCPRAPLPCRPARHSPHVIDDSTPARAKPHHCMVGFVLSHLKSSQHKPPPSSRFRPNLIPNCPPP